MAEKSIKHFDEKNGVRVCALVREALGLWAAARNQLMNLCFIGSAT